MGSLQNLLGSYAKAIARQLPGVDGVYRLFIDSKLNPATGQQTTRYHDVPIRNILLAAVSVREITPAGAGPVQAGDNEMLFPVAPLVEAFQYAKAKDLSTSDLIIIGNVTYRVIVYQYTVNNVMVRIIARRVSK